MTLRTHFHLFVYGSLRKNGSGSSLMRDCEHIGEASIGGVLYDVDGEYRALVLYGTNPVAGEIWRCPNEMLSSLDAYEGLADGLFRRVGVEAGGFACWTYVAGPALARKLLPDHRILR